MDKKLLGIMALGGLGYWLWQNRANAGQGDNYLIDDDATSGGITGFIKTMTDKIDFLSAGANSSMSLSDDYINWLMKVERFSATPYYASAKEKAEGKLTIGFGHVIKSGERFTKITLEEAKTLLQKDFASRINYVRKLKVVLTQSQFDAVFDFIYHAGEGNFAGVAGTTAGRNGLNPQKTFNEQGVTAGFSTFSEYILLLKGRADYAGLLRRFNARMSIAGRGIYAW